MLLTAFTTSIKEILKKKTSYRRQFALYSGNRTNMFKAFCTVRKRTSSAYANVNDNASNANSNSRTVSFWRNGSSLS